jgi:hypothetical protein
LVPLLVPFLTVSVPSACEAIPCRDEPLKRNAVSLRESPIPVFGGSDTKLQELSIARKWAVEATIKLYAIRKADILRGMKLPANVKDKGIKFKVIDQEAIEWYVNHERKDLRNFKSRMAFIVEMFGERVADDNVILLCR